MPQVKQRQRKSEQIKFLDSSDESDSDIPSSSQPSSKIPAIQEDSDNSEYEDNPVFREIEPESPK